MEQINISIPEGMFLCKLLDDTELYDTRIIYGSIIVDKDKTLNVCVDEDLLIYQIGGDDSKIL